MTFLGFEKLIKGTFKTTIIRFGVTPAHCQDDRAVNPTFNIYDHVACNAVLLQKRTGDNYLLHDLDLKQSVSFITPKEYIEDASSYFELIAPQTIGKHINQIVFNALLYGTISDPYAGKTYRKVLDAVGGKFMTEKTDTLPGDARNALYCIHQPVNRAIEFHGDEMYIDNQTINISAQLRKQIFFIPCVHED